MKRGRPQPKPSKEAMRKRESRKRARLAKAQAMLDDERTSARPTIPATPDDAYDAGADDTTMPPLMETAPLDGPGADAFTMSNASTTSAPPPVEDAAPAPAPPADDAAPTTPLVEPTPPPPTAQAIPRPAVTALEVAPMALGISKFFAAGAKALLRKRPDMRRAGAEAFASAGPPGTVTDPMAYLPQAEAFVFATVTNVCVRRNIRIPYIEETIIAFAVGIGAFGFIVKPEDATAGNTDGNTPPTTRVDETPQDAPPPPPNLYSIPPIGK